MGRRCGDKLNPFVINCHCSVLPGMCSPLSPGRGKAGQKDSAKGLPQPLRLGGGNITKKIDSRESQGVEVITEHPASVEEFFYNLVFMC